MEAAPVGGRLGICPPMLTATAPLRKRAKSHFRVIEDIDVYLEETTVMCVTAGVPPCLPRLFAAGCGFSLARPDQDSARQPSPFFCWCKRRNPEST